MTVSPTNDPRLCRQIRLTKMNGLTKRFDLFKLHVAFAKTSNSRPFTNKRADQFIITRFVSFIILINNLVALLGHHPFNRADWPLLSVPYLVS